MYIYMYICAYICFCMCACACRLATWRRLADRWLWICEGFLSQRPQRNVAWQQISNICVSQAALEPLFRHEPLPSPLRVSVTKCLAHLPVCRRCWSRLHRIPRTGGHEFCIFCVYASIFSCVWPGLWFIKKSGDSWQGPDGANRNRNAWKWD